MKIGRMKFIISISLIFFTIWGLMTVEDKVPDIGGSPLFPLFASIIVISAAAVKFYLMAGRFRDIGVASPWRYTFWSLFPLVWIISFPACLVLPSNFSIPKNERKTDKTSFERLGSGAAALVLRLRKSR